ncbi:anti-sigma factor [Antrihabitans cavernicola]|nr:anti-sigma factor [Spelaeibacter cavernicola]
MNDDQIDLAHGYALGILDADEQQAVQRLRASSATEVNRDFEDLVRQTRETLTAISFATIVTPPAALRERLLTQIASGRPDDAEQTVQFQRIDPTAFHEQEPQPFPDSQSFQDPQPHRVLPPSDTDNRTNGAAYFDTAGPASFDTAGPASFDTAGPASFDTAGPVSMDRYREAKKKQPRWKLAAGSMAAAIALLAGGVFIGSQFTGSTSTSTADQVIAAGDVRAANFPVAAGGNATAVFSKSKDAAILLMDNVAPPTDGKVFQMWFITGNNAPVSAGILDAAQVSPASSTVVKGLGNASKLALTVEPSGGSAQPTTTPFIALDLA